MEFQEFEGKSTEEAIEQACAHFQVTAEQLEIEIFSVGSPGLFGLGGRKARIRAALREESEENLLTAAQEILENLLGKMQEKATVSAHPEDDRISLRIETDDAGLLIGKQGQTLDALQYLVTKMLAKRIPAQGAGSPSTWRPTGPATTRPWPSWPRNTGRR